MVRAKPGISRIPALNYLRMTARNRTSPPLTRRSGRRKRGPLRVAYLSRDVGAYSEHVALEIAHFAANHGNWRTLIAYLGEIGLQDIADGKVDGVIIGHWEDAQTLAALAKTRIPVVTTPYFEDNTQFAQVIPDDYAVGVLAAEYLMAKGYRVFAYYGMNAAYISWPWEKLRRAGFIDTLAKRGAKPHIFDNAVPDWWKFQDDRQQDALRSWIQKLPRPAALFACMDRFAYEAVRMARDAQVRVPNDLAVCGVDNIQWICMLCEPRLTSIPLNPRQIGREACRVLNDMMHGGPAHPPPVLIPPLPVVQRASTDFTAFEDTDVAAAHQFIHQHAHQPICVQDVVDKILVSRRSLEMRFRALTNSTLQDEIWQAHVNRARQLLIETAKPMWKIAMESGFRSETVFNVMFRKAVGCTPTAYRRNGGNLSPGE